MTVPAIPAAGITVAATTAPPSSPITPPRTRAGAWRAWPRAVPPSGPGGRGLQATEQFPQRLGVVVQRRAALGGQRGRGPGGRPGAGLLGDHVARFFELAQVDDEVAGGQPDQVLQPGERDGVTL